MDQASDKSQSTLDYCLGKNNNFFFLKKCWPSTFLTGQHSCDEENLYCSVLNLGAGVVSPGNVEVKSEERKGDVRKNIIMKISLNTDISCIIDWHKENKNEVQVLNF